MGALLKEAASRTACAHFGLLCGRSWHLRTSAWSVNSFVTRNVGQRAAHAHGPPASQQRRRPRLRPQHGNVVDVGYAIYHPRVKGRNQIYDGVMAGGCNFMRDLCGPTGRRRSPLSARKARRCRSASAFLPGAVAVRRRVLRVAFLRRIGSATWFAMPTPRNTRSPSEGRSGRSRRPAATGLSRVATAASAGTDLGQRRGTDARHASPHVESPARGAGLTFQYVLDQVRFQVACELLGDTDSPSTMLPRRWATPASALSCVPSGAGAARRLRVGVAPLKRDWRSSVSFRCIRRRRGVSIRHARSFARRLHDTAQRVDGFRPPLRADDRQFCRPADRGLDVPASQVHLALSDGELGALVSIVSVMIAFACRAAVTARRPLEPGQEHLPDGDDMEPRHDRLCVRRQLRGAADRARRRGIGVAAYGSVGAALIATLFPSRMRSSVLSAFVLASVAGSVWASSWAESWRSDGDGMRHSGFRVSPAVARRSCSSPSLATTRRCRCPVRSTPAAGRALRVTAVIVAALLRPRRHSRLHRSRVPAPHRVDDVHVAADLFPSLLRPDDRPGRRQGRAGRAGQRDGRICPGRRRRPLDAAIRVRAPLRSTRRVDPHCGVHG